MKLFTLSRKYVWLPTLWLCWIVFSLALPSNEKVQVLLRGWLNPLMYSSNLRCRNCLLLRASRVSYRRTSLSFANALTLINRAILKIQQCAGQEGQNGRLELMEPLVCGIDRMGKKNTNENCSATEWKTRHREHSIFKHGNCMKIAMPFTRTPYLQYIYSY